MCIQGMKNASTTSLERGSKRGRGSEAGSVEVGREDGEMQKLKEVEGGRGQKFRPERHQK